MSSIEKLSDPVSVLFENPDGSHCFQAILRSVLHRFFPARNYTWEELDQLTGKRPGCWTWPTTALLRLREMGLEVVTLEAFDYRSFADRGEEYLAEYLGPAVAQAQAAHSDLTYEREMAGRFMEQGVPEMRVPDFGDLEELLRQGYLVVCNVNVAVLKGGRGYAGHFVLVYALDERTVWFHDPGPPPAPGRTVGREQFMSVWAFPNEQARNLMAFRIVGGGNPRQEATSSPG